MKKQGVRTERVCSGSRHGVGAALTTAVALMSFGGFANADVTDAAATFAGVEYGKFTGVEYGTLAGVEYGSLAGVEYGTLAGVEYGSLAGVEY